MHITLGMIHGPVAVRVDLGLAPAARGRAESSTSADDGSPSGGTASRLRAETISLQSQFVAQEERPKCQRITFPS
jgi:hypothetical protein